MVGPVENFLFGFSTQFLHSNIFTVRMILNLAKMRTTFCCFHLLNSVLSNIKIFSHFSTKSLSLQRSYFLSLSSMASGGAPTRGRVARTSATACRSRSGDPLGLRCDEPLLSLPAVIWRPIWAPTRRTASLSPRRDLEPHRPKRLYFL